MSEPIFQDHGVIDVTTGKWMTRVAKDPKAGEYSVDERGTYRFSRADDGHSMRIMAHEPPEPPEPRKTRKPLTAEEIAELHKLDKGGEATALEWRAAVLAAHPFLLDEVERSRRIPLADEADVKKLLAIIERSRTLLKRIEWEGDCEHAHGGMCPDCGGVDEHEPGCELAALIGVSGVRPG